MPPAPPGTRKGSSDAASRRKTPNDLKWLRTSRGTCRPTMVDVRASSTSSCPVEYARTRDVASSIVTGACRMPLTGSAISNRSP
jgi:hypothetical protein